MESDIFYDCRWSYECDDRFIDDFNFIQDKVFSGVHSRELFKKQYIYNIYGDSVLVVVYHKNQPIAARSLWRNDILGQVAYQNCRAAVLKQYRGQGIFTKMTKIVGDFLPTKALIYSFPNQYSFQGYKKQGWYNVGQYYPSLFCTKDFIKEHPVRIDNEYFKWWILGNNSMKYIKKYGCYFLVRKTARTFCYKVVALIDASIARMLPKAPLLAIYIYNSSIKKIYNNNSLPLRPVSNQELSFLPLWKIDAV